MKLIAEHRVTNVGAYFVYDCGHATAIGRYAVAKYRVTQSGRVITSHVYRHQQPAALNHGRKWLDSLQPSAPAPRPQALPV